ncbi:Rieske (2Fe-2S) protein [Sinomonas sp. RB5]
MSQDQASAKRPQKFVVARVQDIPEGERLIVDVGGREVGVFNIRGTFYGMLNRCPHVGGPLCRGQLVNTVTSTGPGQIMLDDSEDLLTCPWHNWEFDIKTGQSYWDPKHMRARPFAVDVQHGCEVAEQVESGTLGRIKGPYQAETVEVTVESDYVVLSLRPQRRGQAPSAGACAPPEQSIEEKAEVVR